MAYLITGATVYIGRRLFYRLHESTDRQLRVLATKSGSVSRSRCQYSGFQRCMPFLPQHCVKPWRA